MRRRILFILTVLILLGAIFSLLKAIYKTYSASERIKKSEQEVASLEKRQQELKDELSVKNNLDFVEKEARDKLAMVKPGETIVVVGEDTSKKTTEDGDDSNVPLNNLSNPRKWWYLFFENVN